jgi:hypothetical protein
MIQWFPLIVVAGVFLLVAGALTVIAAGWYAAGWLIRWTQRRNRA